MRRMLKRAYTKLKKLPLVGKLLTLLVQATKKVFGVRRSSAKSQDSTMAGFGDAEQKAMLSRLAAMELLLPSVNNYIASWAEVVSALRSEQVRLAKDLASTNARLDALSEIKK